MPKEYKHLIQKVDGNTRDTGLAIQWLIDVLALMKDGCIEIIVKRAKKHKTWKQCKLLFGYILPTIKQQADDKALGIEDFLVYLLDGNIPKGIAVDEDFLHALMYVIFPAFNEEGERVTVRDMSTQQASDLATKMMNVFAPLRIHVPEPREGQAQ